MAMNFGKLDFAVSFNRLTAFPLDTKSYFESLEAAQAAAATAQEAGSSDSTYYYGQQISVVEGGNATLYIIQPDKSLKEVGSIPVGDDKSIEVADGKIMVKGAAAATSGQQPRIGTNGAIEWYTPDTSTVSGLADTVAGHTTDISNLQESKADKSSVYTKEEADTAISTAISKTNHARFITAESVPSAETAEDNVLYLVMNADSGFYDIYAKVGAQVVRLDDTSVDFSNYYTKTEVGNGFVAKQEGYGLSKNDFTDTLLAKLAGIAEGAEVNVVKSVGDELAVDESGKLSFSAATVETLEKIATLETEVGKKVDAVAGKGLSTNDYTTEEKTLLASLAGAQANIIESISIGGASLGITDKNVEIPVATASALGVVKGSAEENGVAISESGEMSVNSVSIQKLAQADDEWLILDGGDSAGNKKIN